jgi:hypothetical protein
MNCLLTVIKMIILKRHLRIVVSTLRCGRKSPGSIPGGGTFFNIFVFYN